jgi:tRNA dimethylallyltransferase
VSPDLSAPAPSTPLIVILGPTGAGKSDLSLHLARALNAEIVNFDSVQVYRGFDIGSAKLPVADRQGIPHHLIDIVEPAELFTAADYARLAQSVIRDIAARGKLPVLVGGTGFYLRGLLQGLSPGPSRNETLRSRLVAREQSRPGSLHRILRRLDAASASRIHRNDKNKTLRALEIRLVEGAPVSNMFERGRSPLSGFTPMKIGLDPPRDLLYARLNERTRRMFQADSWNRGIVSEVKELLRSGVPPDAKPFASLGYKQAIELIQGKLTAQQALESTQMETRRYAKRQLTWFRKEQNVEWIPGFGDDPQVHSRALLVAQRALAREAKK